MKKTSLIAALVAAAFAFSPVTAMADETSGSMGNGAMMNSASEKMDSSKGQAKAQKAQAKARGKKAKASANASN